MGTFARCLTMALCQKANQEEIKDIPFLASSKHHAAFFKAIIKRGGNIAWYELFQNLSSSALMPLLPESTHKITLIVDGLDELSAPQEIIQSLANFLGFELNGNIIKRIIITSRPGC